MSDRSAFSRRLGYQRAEEASQELAETGLTVEYFPHGLSFSRQRSARPYALFGEGRNLISTYSTVEAALRGARHFLSLGVKTDA